MDCGYWFKWPPGKDPYFVKPNGDIVRLYVHNNVPYLNEDNAVTALPADDDEEGAIEVLELQQALLVMWKVSKSLVIQRMLRNPVTKT
eukprot:13356831-Heterocapsa_arctica.AAC.1